MPKSTPERIIDRAYGSAGRSGVYVASPSGSSVGGASAFVELSDTPNTYAGQGGLFLAVSGGESSIAFRAIIDADIPNTLVRTSRALTGGDGINAIGDLSADRTISVDATVARTATQIIAGAGLTGGGDLSASRTLNVGAGAGITVNADDVALTTPGSLSATSSNSASGNHTHAIDATIARSAIQINSGNGLTGGGDLTASRTLNVGAGAGITVNADDVAVNQGYGFAWTANHSWTGNLQHPDYASQTSNWRISGAGAADFRYLFADEMHVKSFIADLEQALAGGQIISKSVAVLSRNFTAPAAGGTATLYVWDLPSAEDMAVFQSGDLVRLRSFSRASGSLTVADCWGVVTSYSNLTGKEQSWTFTRSAAPNAGAMSAGATVQADSLALDYGTTGNGFHEINAIDGAYAVNSPYSQVVTWSGHPASGQTVRTRTGNLTGLAFPSGPANEYGFYAGNGRQVADQYVRISTWGSELHNLPLRLYAGGVATVAIDPSYPSIAVGDNAANVTYDADTNAGFFVGKRPSTGEYTFRLGDEAQYIKWDGATLTISGVIRIVDGSDVASRKYFIDRAMFWTGVTVEPIWTTSTEITFIGSAGIGTITNALGEEFVIANMPTAQGVESATVERGHQDVVMYVLKSGVGMANPDSVGGTVDYAGIDNPATVLGLNFVEVFYERTDYYYNNAIYSQATRQNHVLIGQVRLNSDSSAVVASFGAGSVGATILGPGYIRTDTLDAISANLGEITSGSIEIGSTNKLWLNVDNDSLKLAVGGATRASAPFRVYENGMMYVGDGSGNMQYVPGTGFSVKGTINADAGYLGSLTVSGTLAVTNPGKITWNDGDGILDQYGIYMQKASSGASARLWVGRPYLSNPADQTSGAEGFFDIDMAKPTDSTRQWNYAIHVRDGGNNLTSASALYHGQSKVVGNDSIDRIFDAYTGSGSYSDGFYAELAGGTWDSGAPFDSKGAAFKGKHSAGGAVAVFNQNGSSISGAPVVWASTDQGVRSIYMAAGATGANAQTAFRALPNGATNNGGLYGEQFLALDAGNALIGYAKGLTLKDTSDSDVPTPPSGYYILYMNLNALKVKRADGRVQYYSVAGEYLP